MLVDQLSILNLTLRSKRSSSPAVPSIATTSRQGNREAPHLGVVYPYYQSHWSTDADLAPVSRSKGRDHIRTSLFGQLLWRLASLVCCLSEIRESLPSPVLLTGRGLASIWIESILSLPPSRQEYKRKKPTWRRAKWAFLLNGAGLVRAPTLACYFSPFKYRNSYHNRSSRWPEGSEPRTPAARSCHEIRERYRPASQQTSRLP